MDRRTLMILSALSLTISVISPAMARGGGGGHPHSNFHRSYHPRMHEMRMRNQNMNRRLDRDYGHLGGNFGKLQNERRGVAQQERKDYRQNGGYLTKNQKQQFNKDDNQLNRQIASDYRSRGNWNRGPNNNNRGWDANRNRWDNNHPRQAQVLGSDNRLGKELQHDKGNLGGNYSALKSQQQSIRQEDAADRKANGGYITKAQRQQMDQQEHQLQQQIKSDYKAP